MSTNFNTNINLSFLPERNAYTNPSAISNSGASYFTNQKSKILKLNLNLVSNGDALNNFLISQFEELKSGKNQQKIMTENIIDNDFLTILQNQKNNSRLEKFYNSNNWYHK